MEAIVFRRLHKNRPVSLETARKALDMRAAGLSQTRICRELGLHHTTYKRLVHRATRSSDNPEALMAAVMAETLSADPALAERLAWLHAAWAPLLADLRATAEALRAFAVRIDAFVQRVDTQLNTLQLLTKYYGLNPAQWRGAARREREDEDG